MFTMFLYFSINLTVSKIFVRTDDIYATSLRMVGSMPVPEFIDLVFAKTSPKSSFQ
jgi:hypothetical protein